MEMERPVRRDDDSLSQDSHSQGGEKWPDSRALGPCPAVPWHAQVCGAVFVGKTWSSFWTGSCPPDTGL